VRVRAVLLYTVLRVLAFAVPFGILYRIAEARANGPKPGADEDAEDAGRAG
jgi:hypothetical protein